MRINLVHNNGAGDGHYNRDSLLQLIRGHGHEVAYFDVTDDWQPSSQAPADLIVAAGGDGTVEKVARRLAGSGIPIGVLPLGTANNVATALGIAATPVPELVASWARAEHRPFDTGHARGQGDAFRFVESVGMGLLAESIAEITEGSAGYVDTLDDAQERMDAAIEVLRGTLGRLEPTPMTLIIDGEPMSGDYLMIEVMNFGCAGPNLCLAPGGVEADGLFDIVVAHADNRSQLIEALHHSRPGIHGSHSLPVYRAGHVILNSAEYRLHLDDQLRECSGPIELTAERHGLTFLV